MTVDVERFSVTPARRSRPPGRRGGCDRGTDRRRAEHTGDFLEGEEARDWGHAAGGEVGPPMWRCCARWPAGCARTAMSTAPSCTCSSCSSTTATTNRPTSTCSMPTWRPATTARCGAGIRSTSERMAELDVEPRRFPRLAGPGTAAAALPDRPVEPVAVVPSGPP
ncbi:hypothetical protein HBB16_05185 [Pseudonocardia sp. MCCB 268]|nr:hypothetical protein [Pseudonocardia cytotoxica]